MPAGFQRAISGRAMQARLPVATKFNTQVARSASKVRRSVAATLCCAMLTAFDALPAQGDAEVLSNASVVQMVTGKLPKNLILSKIAASRPGFDLSTSGLLALQGSKVDESLVKAMFASADSARQRGSAPSALTGLDETLTNDAIVKLVSARVPKGIILTKMRVSPSAYDVTASGLVSLNTSKVPQDLIKLMMDPPVPPVPASSAAPKSSTPGARSSAPVRITTMPPDVAKLLKPGKRLDRVWIGSGYDKSQGFRFSELLYQANERVPELVSSFPAAVKTIAKTTSPYWLVVAVTDVDKGKAAAGKQPTGKVSVQGWITDKSGEVVAAFKGSAFMPPASATGVTGAKAAVNTLVAAMGVDLR